MGEEDAGVIRLYVRSLRRLQNVGPCANSTARISALKP